MCPIWPRESILRAVTVKAGIFSIWCYNENQTNCENLVFELARYTNSCINKLCLFMVVISKKKPSCIGQSSMVKEMWKSLDGALGLCFFCISELVKSWLKNKQMGIMEPIVFPIRIDFGIFIFRWGGVCGNLWYSYLWTSETPLHDRPNSAVFIAAVRPAFPQRDEHGWMAVDRWEFGKTFVHICICVHPKTCLPVHTLHDICCKSVRLQILRGSFFLWLRSCWRWFAMSCGGSDSSESGDAPCEEQDCRIDAYVTAFAEYPRLKEVLFMQKQWKYF